VSARGRFMPRLTLAGAALLAGGAVLRSKTTTPARPAGPAVPGRPSPARAGVPPHHPAPHPAARPAVPKPQHAVPGRPAAPVSSWQDRVHAATPWVIAAGVLALAVAGLVARDRRRGGWAATGLVAAYVGCLLRVLPADTPGRGWWPLLLAGGAAVTVSTLWVWRAGRSGSARTVRRWSRRSRRHDGVATRAQILRTASRFAVRRKMRVLRPSLARLSWWQRLRVPTSQIATPLARVGRLRVWSTVEDVTLRVGGPRIGKTGELAGRILDAPGAVIATSTRTDLINLTAACRARIGPVYVFNPSGVAGATSTVTFDPLAGCADPATATYRAADLLAGTSSPGTGGDREFWTDQARRVLAALLHAAALGGVTMHDVLAWVAAPDEGAAEIQQYLRRSSQPAYVSDALQFLETNDRTRSSICATIMPALGWLSDATATAGAGITTGAGPAGPAGLDVATLLAECGTVYMLGAEDARTAPLVTAFTGHVAREARRLAGLMPGGRLDPPLTLVLDEAALICPVPLDNWTADMGGRGVPIHICAQSRAQLRQRWGDVGAAAILNNAATLLVYGGVKDDDDLTAYSLLTGERDEDVLTLDADGRLTGTTSRRVPVLSPAQIAQLPAGRVLIIRRGMPPAIGRVRMAWRRHDVRAARRAAWRTALAGRVADRLAPVREWMGERLGETTGPVISRTTTRGPAGTEREEDGADV
jgi:type IV secretion system protein VirD4